MNVDEIKGALRRMYVPLVIGGFLGVASLGLCNRFQLLGQSLTGPTATEISAGLNENIDYSSQPIDWRSVLEEDGNLSVDQLSEIADISSSPYNSTVIVRANEIT